MPCFLVERQAQVTCSYPPVCPQVVIQMNYAMFLVLLHHFHFVVFLILALCVCVFFFDNYLLLEIIFAFRGMPFFL